MAQPPAYNRYFNFYNQQQLTPSDPLNAEKVDGEYNRIKTTLDAVLNNLALIQRDDGVLANDSVGLDQLSPSVNLTFTPPEPWATSTSYTADSSTVFQENKFYICATSHTSGTFSTDLGSGYWTELADFSSAVIADNSVSTAKLQDEAVTNAKLAHMAADTIKGRANGAGTGDATDLTAAQVRTILNVENGATADQTAADIRALGFFDTSNDGTGSGLDADTVDGVEAAAMGQLGVAAEWTRRQNFNETSLTSSSNSVAWDVAQNQVAAHTLTENTTFAAPSNMPAGTWFAVRITQHASSAKTVGWNSVFKAAGGSMPTMTSTTSAVDLYVFWSDGTNAYLVGYQQDLS